MTKHTLIDLNPIVSSETKDINVKLFNMITKIVKLKHLQSILYVIVKGNLILQHVIQIKNGILKHNNVSVKIILRTEKNIIGILAHIFIRIVSM